MASREDPLVAFKFGLEIEGKLTGFFTNANGIGSETEVIEQKVTNPETGETIINKIPGEGVRIGRILSGDGSMPFRRLRHAGTQI